MSEHYVRNLDETQRQTSINLLKPALAAAIDLQLAVKQAHWTIKGSSFIGLHELLDEVAGRSYEHSDTIAERIVILGGQTHGTTQKVAENTALKAYPSDITDQTDHVRELTDRLMHFGGMCRDGIAKSGENEDEDTADLFTEISREIDKDAWFIGAHNA
jgi:starvation-inducible DNA-binding protein